MSSLNPSSAVRLTPAVVRVLEWHSRKLGAARQSTGGQAERAERGGREQPNRSTSRERAAEGSSARA